MATARKSKKSAARRRPDPRVTLRMSGASITGAIAPGLGPRLVGEPAREQFDIDKRLERLSLCVCELAGVANELEKRLHRVTFPAPAEAVGDDKPVPTPLMTRLSEQVDGHASSVHAVTEQLRSVIERLGI